MKSKDTGRPGKATNRRCRGTLGVAQVRSEPGAPFADEGEEEVQLALGPRPAYSAADADPADDPQPKAEDEGTNPAASLVSLVRAGASSRMAGAISVIAIPLRPQVGHYAFRIVV